MSILSWLREVTAGSHTAFLDRPLKFARGEEHFRGLDMREALELHNQWTHRLEALIEGTSSEQPEIGVLASDNQCTLGEWIHGYAKRHFSALAEYQELQRIHSNFHLTAARILNDLRNGSEELSQEECLRQIRHKSGHVQLALVRLYSAVREGVASS
jgi:hypothetical protein